MSIKEWLYKFRTDRKSKLYKTHNRYRHKNILTEKKQNCKVQIWIYYGLERGVKTAWIHLLLWSI